MIITAAWESVISLVITHYLPFLPTISFNVKTITIMMMMLKLLLMLWWWC